MDGIAGRAASLLVLGATGVVAAGTAPAALSVESLRAHVETLADDAMQGREAGRPAIRAAERYIRDRFAAAGLKPLPAREDFYVDVTLYRQDYDPERTRFELGEGESRRVGRPGVDFRPLDASDEGAVTAPLVFAGYGISAPELDYDDYAGLDVRDKVVLVLRHEPRETDAGSSFDGTENTRHAQFRAKVERAREHGAAGLVLVTDPLHHGKDDDLRLGGRLTLEPVATAVESDEATEASALPAIQVSQALIREWLDASGIDLAAWQRALDDGRRAAELTIPPVRVRLGVARDPEPVPVPARDLVGVLPGSDPDLAGEWILIGAHHDHIGGYPGEGDTVFNGADDNASGTAAVLELARAFAARERRPRRTLAFATFTAEEKGLLGSHALVDRALIPVDRIGFMLNLDMIGRNPDRPMEVIGDGYGRGSRDRLEAVVADGDPPLRFAGTSYAANSDHDAFYEAGIPFLFFFTGTHADYHRRGDHADKLDYPRMQRIASLAYRLIGDLADADRLPTFVHHLTWLGASVEQGASADGTDWRFTGVEPGSPAEAAGLRVGDRILRFGGDPADDAGNRLRATEPGASVEVVVSREAGPLTIALQRPHTGYLGIGTGEVDDELRGAIGLSPGEGLLVRSVADGGPADTAGLESGDVIVRIAGRAVDRGSLPDVLSQIGAGETVEVELIRDGERIVKKLTLGERPRRPR